MKYAATEIALKQKRNSPCGRNLLKPINFLKILNFQEHLILKVTHKKYVKRILNMDYLELQTFLKQDVLFRYVEWYPCPTEA